MALQPIKWWQSLSGDTQKLVLQAVFGFPYAIYFTYLFCGNVLEWYSRETPNYMAVSIPAIEPVDVKFFQEEREKVKNFAFETLVVIENGTSQSMTEVVVLLPRTKGYWGSSDKPNIPLEPFNGRIDIPVINPQKQVTLTIWHNDAMRIGEKVIISSKEHKKFTFSFEEQTAIRDYRIPFWIANGIILILVTIQIIAWRRQKPASAKLPSEAAPSATPTESRQGDGGGIPRQIENKSGGDEIGK